MDETLGDFDVFAPPVDLFSQMRAAHHRQRSRIQAAVQPNSPEVQPITVREMLRGATLGGAQGAGAGVQHMDTSNIDTVIVGGRIIKGDGQLAGVEVETVLRQLEHSAAGLVGRSRATEILFTGCRQQHQ
ncbi:amidohydrolase family protein [Nocardia asteroides]|uniref:hypothetical protein n=1 Tax=Nocardia asteroides TaxID=1824 RepID=UPI00365832CE